MNTRDIVVKFRVDSASPDGAVRRRRCWINLGNAPSTNDAVERWLDWCRRTCPGGTVHYRGGFHGNTKYVAPGATVHFRGLCRPLGCLENYEEVPYEARP